MLYQAVVKELVGLPNVGLVVSLYFVQDCSYFTTSYNKIYEKEPLHELKCTLWNIEVFKKIFKKSLKSQKSQKSSKNGKIYKILQKSQKIFKILKIFVKSKKISKIFVKYKKILKIFQKSENLENLVHCFPSDLPLAQNHHFL